MDETITIAAPTHHVWEAITDPKIRARWWAYLDLDPTVGGRFEERWTDSDGSTVLTHGRVLDLSVARMLRLSWADEDWEAATDVEIRLEESADGTHVRIRHTGWERLPDAGALAADHRAGWQMHLHNLKALVERAA